MARRPKVVMKMGTINLYEVTALPQTEARTAIGFIPQCRLATEPKPKGQMGFLRTER